MPASAGFLLFWGEHMTVVVETGAVTAGANSYASVAEATTYLTNRAREAVWAAYTTAQREGYLIEATAYLDAHVEWQGTQISSTQALGWPRGGVVNRYGIAVSSTAVPDAVKAAVIEIAAQGAPAVVAARLKESVTVGPISTTYAGGGDPAQGMAKHKYALRLLDGLVVGGVGNAIRLVRA